MDQYLEHITRLYYRQQTGEITSAEREELNNWLQAHPYSRDYLANLFERENINDLYTQRSPAALAGIDSAIYSRIQKALAGNKDIRSVRRTAISRMAWIRYAAVFFILFGIGAYIWNQKLKVKNENLKVAVNNNFKNDIGPGSNKAVLTLSDGRKIELSDKTTEQINDGGLIISNEPGKLFYKKDAGVSATNTMSTPKGGQYQLTLSDGTKVWLNAASAITYPTVFVEKQRKIKITGEAYLEVAMDKQKPFIVDVNGKSSVEVLGTSFNINSYINENVIRTTLIEGSVRVAMGEKMSLLKPGQRAEVMQNDNSVKVISNVDIDQTLAWKNGIFNLENLSLQEFARQLERWYDIEVKYEGVMPETNFEGRFRKDVKLSAILSWFSKLGIQNRLEGRLLILSAK